MATCAGCGKETRDDDWTCGYCGAPVAGAQAAGDSGAGAYGYAPGPGSQPPAYEAPMTYGAPVAAPAAGGGLSRATVTVILVAAVAIVAIIAVWFFVVRGGPTTNGDEFLGTWNATGSGIGNVVVARPGDDFEITMTGADPAQKITVPAHVHGDELVITVDDFAALAEGGSAKVFKDTLKAVAGDFRIVFASVDSLQLQMRIEGTSTSGQDSQSTTTLTKASP